MPILLTLFRALFWVALPVIGAACAGVYCSDRTRRDLSQEIAPGTMPNAISGTVPETMPGFALETAPEVPRTAKQPVASGAHVQDI